MKKDLYPNKAITNKDVSDGLQPFMFPHTPNGKPLTIRAKSIAEAEKEYQKIINNKESEE